ncbi:hypothetical protein B9Z65_8407 [Elsinoe australis]|uniref:Nascent polypeptide-associated complex subunit alpha-like UBA domain-containing protein n=1 Tax=Elsinoe australis TaxID=40998 RepID=A0A2P7YDN5_9PEZI|nr:hypothetical protein B9Z65_8407 [Elsinoe australis]
MAEPQPPAVQEGDTTRSVPASADDKTAAAALSSLDQPSMSTDNAAPKKDIDSKAIGDAMQRLTVSEGQGGGAGKEAAKAEKKEEQEPAKKVKIEAADVNLVVDQCDLSKVKATELLRGYDGDLGRALRGWVGVGA